VFYAILTAVVAIVAGLLTRRRISAYYEEESTRLTDDHIRQLEQHGYVALEDPLDVREAQQEEDEFWEQSSWEEPDEM
jgi:hypothetical protein